MISSYFVDTMQLLESAHDDWGKITYTATTLPCYIHWGTRMVKDINGTDAVSKARILCADREISYDDKIGIGGVEYAILQIDHRMAFNMPHLEITIQ